MSKPRLGQGGFCTSRAQAGACSNTSGIWKTYLAQAGLKQGPAIDRSNKLTPTPRYGPPYLTNQALDQNAMGQHGSNKSGIWKAGLKQEPAIDKSNKRRMNLSGS